MRKRIISAVLSMLMLFSCFSFVSAEETAATITPLNLSSVKANNGYVGALMNYSERDVSYDPKNDIVYERFISADKTDADVISPGGSSEVVYIDRYSLGIDTSSLSSFYVAFYARTNAASTPQFFVLAVTGASQYAVKSDVSFKGDGTWEKLVFEVPVAEEMTKFNQAHLRLGTPDDSYFDLAAYGVFSSKADAENYDWAAAVKPDSSKIYSVTFNDADGNAIKTEYGYTTISSSLSVTTPDYEDTADAIFAGWTETKDSYNVAAEGGATYTMTGTTSLYPVWKNKVRFVNGSAETNGDGMTPETPYTSFASAAADLRTTGGTIVVTGSSTYSALSNTGDITITSVYNNVDYRTADNGGAVLAVGQPNFGYISNGTPGKVVFSGINLQTNVWWGVYIQGHPAEFTETCNFQTADGTKIINIQLMGLISGTASTTNHTHPMDITVGNTNCTTIILGARSDVAISDVNITITETGTLGSIALSNNTGTGQATDYGQLSINGDVKVTVNGKLTDAIYARSATYDSTGLASFNGNIAVIVNTGGTMSKTIADTAKPTNGKWFTIKGCEGTTLAHGENGGDIVLTLDNGLDYNFVNLTNSTTSSTYAYFIEDGVSAFTLPESGEYTMTLTKNESKTISFKDTKGGNTVEDITTIAGLTITLPTLPDTELLFFKGWTDVENSDVVKYNAGETYTVSDNATLYAVWEEPDSYTVTFMNGEEEFASFTGVEGKSIKYPDTYPAKDGSYFTGWDKNPTVIGTEDITLNATFKSAEEVAEKYGAVYYWNGNAASEGDGTYAKPFKTMATLVAALNKTGGIVVVMGKCSVVYQPNLTNTEDVTFTALDPLTGVDFGGDFDQDSTYNGGHIYLPQGVYWGGATTQTGAIIFENVDILNFKGQYGYGHMTFDGHEFVVGENVRHLNASTGEAVTWFTGMTSPNYSADPHIVKGVFKSPFDGANYLARGGGGFEVDRVEYDFYAKSTVTLSQDGGEIVTINGPVLLTYYAGSTGSKVYHNKTSYAFGSKAYASIVLNDGVTITNGLDMTEDTGLNGKAYIINSPVGGTVTSTDTKGTYYIESDEYNYAKLLDSEGDTVDEGIIVGGAELYAPAYGEYTVEYSNETLYGVTYVTTPYDEICPKPYAVTSEETDKHVIALPTLEKQNAHIFEGWTTTEGGTTAEYAGGAEYTLNGEITLYAVWKEIPTYTVTFKDDNGETIHTATGYAGAPLTFPTENPYKYGEKLLGYAYEGTSDVLGEDALIPDSDKIALPVWGEIPAGETRLYVSASGNDENTGISPDVPLATIAAAVAKLRTDGGYIIVTDGAVKLTGSWNNSGDITLTSLDPVSGIDYRATIKEDKTGYENGAYLIHNAWIMFGSSTNTGKITINNIIFHGDDTASQSSLWTLFEGHPYELGDGISATYQNSESAPLIGDKAARLSVRTLGDTGAVPNVDKVISITVGDLDCLSTIYALGVSTETVAGIDVTFNAPYDGSFKLSNDGNRGGYSTVNGDVTLTFNGSVASGVTQSSGTNPINGNIYAVYNNNSTAKITVSQASGYGIYSLNAGGNVVLSHGTNGAFIIEAKDGIGGKYVKITDSDGNIVGYTSIVDGKAEITLEAVGTYTAEFTDVAMRMLTFDTGDENVTVDGSGWYKEGSEVEIPTDLYRYGYNFLGWTDGTNTYTEGIITMPEQNVTLTAVWENAPKYTVAFDANGADIEVPEPAEEFENENLVLEKVKAKGATFLGWSETADGAIGVLNHKVTKDTTLYAVTSAEPVYIIDSYYRGDPNNYTGNRNSFRRYVIDVYLENAVASEGSFKLNTDNKFLYYLGHVPVDGIDAEVTASVVSGNSGTPGLQYFTTPSIEFKWTSAEPVDTSNGRRRVARIMMYFSSWGMGYNQIEARTTDEVVSPFAGYTATVDGETALVSTNFYKGVKSDEVKVTGKVSFTGRESGVTPKYDYAKLYILDSAGDAVEYIVPEQENTAKSTVSFEASIAPGDYTVKVIKNGYMERSVPAKITEECELAEIVMYAGDTSDESGTGDGKVDVDDFIRVLRGFSDTFPIDKYRSALDLNEDGNITVNDLAVIKKGLLTEAAEVEISASTDRSMKLGDWKLSVADGVLNISGGSEEAIASARSLVENEFYKNGKYTGPQTFSHSVDYDIYNIVNNGVSLGDYRIVIAENDETALKYAQYIYDYIAEISGFGLDIVYDTEAENDYEIVVGGTSRGDNPIADAEKYMTYEENGKFFVFYGDEQSAEMACLDLCEKILGKESAGFNGVTVNVVPGARSEGAWSVLSRFGVMSDSHVGVRYNWANYNWLQNAFTNFESIHAQKPLDFIVSLGDNIDDGYANTYATDYAIYLEQIKGLDICDPVNPIEGRADGMIPHYELCGNHDPIGGQTDDNGELKIRFFKNRLWYTENENGEKVAHIGFFTNYGGYPLYNYEQSGSYASYFSYGRVDDAMVKFVEESIIEANAEGAKHIILYNHFGMSQQVGSPCLPETGLGKIASVCEQYDIKLYFNGHEHNVPYTLRRYNDIYDYDVSMTSQKHAVVEITTLRAKVTIYNSADNSLFREDIVPLSGRGEAVQKFAK